MSIPSRVRSRPSAGRAPIVGFAALARFSAACSLSLTSSILLAACSDDAKPARQTEPSGTVLTVDASVRRLPGDGVDLTPEIDIDSRQREPIGPQRLNDQIERLRNGQGGSGGQSGAAPDAATEGPVDAGTD